MPLQSGEKLGPYDVLALIGKGGMGEVYRARDTKLKREVAIKVLPEAFTSDAARLARFQREAEMLASLNHPNIAHVYGIEDRAIVMELVEGQTLPCPLPVEEAIRIAQQIIAALEYAHERGVIHRDLKPANIKITPEGVVKVLDFGLAKVLDEYPARSTTADSPTLTLGHTRAGVILGTAAYMSPEQAVGKAADRRSDIFSFGAVLYEMLTGHQAFTGDSGPEILVAVAKDEPDWSKLPAGSPEALLRRCLTKDRKQRLQAIGEARIALEAPPSGTESPSRVASLPPKDSRTSYVTRAMAALAGALGIVAGYALWPRAPELRPLTRLEVDLGADVALLDPNDAGGPAVILSADGTRIVYAASTAGGQTKLFTRRLDQAKATELPGTDGANQLVLSPDEQWVAFLNSSGKLSKISVEGGAMVPLADVGGIADWDSEGIVYTPSQRGLMRMPPGGGTATSVLDLADGEYGFAEPQLLPGGKAAIFTSYKTRLDVATATIEAVTLSDHKRRILVRGGVSSKYVPGYLLYTSRSALFALPFDAAKLETQGTAQQILDEIAISNRYFFSQYAFSQAPDGHGTLVYRKGTSGATAGSMTLQWVDPAGKKEPLTSKMGTYSNPRISPDGERLAVQLQGDIWAYEWKRDAWIKLTFGGGSYIAPVWSPDGRYIVFGSIGSGSFWTRADGSGQPQQLLANKTAAQIPASFSPDGKRLAYTVFDRSDNGTASAQTWTVPLEDAGGQLKAGKPEPFLQDKFNDNVPMFSPDGRWMAYMSDESGRSEVYVRAFPPTPAGGKWLISTSGGTSATWSRNGHDLLYKSGDQVMAVNYTVKGDSFVPDKPRVWLAKFGAAANANNAPMWDLAPDGKRVAVVALANPTEAPKADHEVVFLVNFLDELKRRVPSAK